jgi:aromatic ring-cleaving dioxygenase
MFSVEDHGSIVLIRPLTDDVRDWLADHTDDEAQWFGRALVVEPRYVVDIVTALVEEGYAAQ